MEIFFSAIVGDLISRSASVVINKFCQQRPSTEANLHRLHRVLLRVDTILEEAEGRNIANQRILRRLNVMRQELYRGHYILDVSKYGHLQEKEVSHQSSSNSNFSRAKRLRSDGSGSRREEQVLDTINMQELEQMADTLENTIANMKEFVVLLASYPRVRPQPYYTYLLLENCMFGRQNERQQILNFLLQSESPTAANFDVLAIVGPTRVGKSTLVEHVCREHLVRDHFSTIILLPEKRLKDEREINLRENINGVVKHQSCASQSRLFVIIETPEHIDEGTWRRLESCASCTVPSGSKIIITGRSKKILSLGTTEALHLDYLPRGAYWHFFKMLAFGSTDPDEQPKMAAMAMEIASEQRRCFISALLVAELLRDNFNAQFWCTILKRMRASRNKHLSLFNEHPNLLMLKDEPVYCWRLTTKSRYFLICGFHQLDSTEEAPKINTRDIVLGSCGALPCGQFEALQLKSRIAPYYNYTICCMMQARQPRKKCIRHMTLDLSKST